MAAAEKYEPYDFANRRHIGPSPEEMAEMLRVVGVSNLDQLIAETVPEAIRQRVPLDFGLPLSERGVLDRMRATANKNRVLTSLIGQGYHGTIMPPARIWTLRRCSARFSSTRAWAVPSTTSLRSSPSCTPPTRSPSLPPTPWRSLC